MGTFYKTYNDAFDLHIPFSKIGAPTNPMVARQLEEFSKLLNQGMKNIEIGTIDPTKFEQIPRQHFEEVRRLAKITDSHPSVHAPLLDLAGLPTQEGERNWKEEQRESTEQQVFSVLERTHQLSNGENIPVVFHAGRFPGSQEFGIPWDPKTGREGLKREVIDEKTGKTKIVPSVYRSLGVVNQDTGDIQRVEYEEKYFIGREKPEVWDPFKRIESLNSTQWEDEKLKTLNYQKDIEELKERMEVKRKQNESIQKTQLYEDPEYARLLEANRRDINLLSNHIQEINRKLSSDYHGIYDKFKRFAHPDDKKENEKKLKEMDDQYNNIEKQLRNKYEERNKLYQSIESTGSEEEARKYAEQIKKIQDEIFNISLDRSKAVVTTLATLPTPEVWTPIKDFAMEKTSDTAAGAIAKLYKKLKDEGKGEEKKMPFIAIENFFTNTAMSRGEELKQGIMLAREKLAKKLVNECKLSKETAEKEAEKLIGATWDVGHINNLRKAGYEGEELKKEILKDTKAVADVTKHVHITDNFGFFDSHLAPGMGNVPIKEIMEEMEKTWAREEAAGRLHQRPRGIVEAGGFVAEIGQNPTIGIMEYFGSPFYKISPSPYWGGTRSVGHTYSPYLESFIDFPQQHFNLYGSSFTTLPKTVGGQVGGETSRFSGTPNQ